MDALRKVVEGKIVRAPRRRAFVCISMCMLTSRTLSVSRLPLG